MAQGKVKRGNKNEEEGKDKERIRGNQKIVLIETVRGR